MANIPRNRRKFEIAKTKLRTDFAIPEVPIAWFWEGRGRDGNLVARRPDTTNANTPVPGVTLRTERYVLIPSRDIYQLYFTSIPAGIFQDTVASQNTTNIVFELNREE